MELLEKLCGIHAPSGEEFRVKDFLLDYIEENKKNWKAEPVIVKDDIQDNLMMVFGKPRTVVFAHMDSVGFTIRYSNQLVKIGGPVVKDGVVLTGTDSIGDIEGVLKKEEDSDKLHLEFERTIERGTSLIFKKNFRNEKDYVTSRFLDNRLGVWIALKLAEVLEDGIIAFTSWEEHGGGSVEVLSKIIYQQYQVSQALVADITWVTDGVKHGEGVAITMRDKNIPRRLFVDKLIGIAEKSGIKYQLEVEGAGSSDGGYLQKTAYPFDWGFIGAPEDNVHSPDEKVHKDDIKSMLEMYKVMMKEL